MKISLAAFLLFFTTSSFSQRDDNPNNLKGKIFELSVKTIPSESLKLPFESIKIIDGRFDTSKIRFQNHLEFSSTNNVFEK